MLKNSESELVRILLLSTYRHVSSCIGNKKNRQAYHRAMRMAFYVCSEANSGNDLERMRDGLQEIAFDYPSRFSQRIEFFSNTKKYYMMGIEHSLDIVNSVNKRFVRGHQDDSEKFVADNLT